MSNFITNSGAENLKKRLIELINKSEYLKFLVGFFYFSGIKELYQGLKSNPEVKINVLVGLNVDKTNYGLLEYGDPEKELSDEERCYKFFESIKKSLNTEYFDKKEFYEQVKYFLGLIRKDKLIIRKTYNPNHAKIYIFKLQEGQVGRNNLFITGSSNLTNSGLSTQEEFNVEISDYGFDDAEHYFDSLWNEAIKITEDSITKKRLLEVVEKETLVKEITPFEAFLLVLHAYLSSFEQKEIGESLIETLEKHGYTPYRYQLDAVKQALAIIENNNGVIIADVVGLGKTIVACAVAKQLKKRGVVICPPGLIGDRNKNSGWKKYAEEFSLYDWEIRSLGDLENISEFVQKTKDIEVIIIDEAHRSVYQKYQAIFEYFDSLILGLTATPKIDIDHNTYNLFGLEDHMPSYSYELEQAVSDKFLVPYKGIAVPVKFIREGIKYNELSNEEKQEYEVPHRPGRARYAPLPRGRRGETPVPGHASSGLRLKPLDLLDTALEVGEQAAVLQAADSQLDLPPRPVRVLHLLPGLRQGGSKPLNLSGKGARQDAGGKTEALHRKPEKRESNPKRHLARVTPNRLLPALIRHFFFFFHLKASPSP